MTASDWTITAFRTLARFCSAHLTDGRTIPNWWGGVQESELDVLKMAWLDHYLRLVYEPATDETPNQRIRRAPPRAWQIVLRRAKRNLCVLWNDPNQMLHEILEKGGISLKDFSSWWDLLNTETQFNIVRSWWVIMRALGADQNQPATNKRSSPATPILEGHEINERSTIKLEAGEMGVRVVVV